jgi:glycine hydroxymethyltransferase
MEEAQMVEIANLIGNALENPQDEEQLADVRSRVLDLCERFPLYSPLP